MLTVGLLLLAAVLIVISAIVDKNENIFRYLLAIGTFTLGVELVRIAGRMLYY